MLRAYQTQYRPEPGEKDKVEGAGEYGRRNDRLLELGLAVRLCFSLFPAQRLVIGHIKHRRKAGLRDLLLITVDATAE